MKKAIIAACAIIICAGLFYFFYSYRNTSEKTPAAQPVEQIGFFHYFSGTLSGGISEMVEEINSSQDRFNIAARALDHEAFKSMIYTTLEKENPPQLFSYWAGARVQNLVEKGKLAPIDDLWEQEKFDEKFTQSIIDAACMYNGNKYLVPIDQFLVVFFYDKRIFKQYGLIPPRNWNEFLTLCRTIKQKGLIPIALGSRERWPAQFWLDYLLLRTSGADYREELMNGTAGYLDDEVKNVYRMWSDLLQKGYFNENANELDWTDATLMVSDQKAAMTLMGTWAVQALEKNNSCENYEDCFDFFPFPQINKNIPKVALGPIDGIVLSKNSDHHASAKKALAYFAGPKPQERLSMGAGGFAPSLEVPLSSYPAFQQRIIAEIKTAGSWAFNYDLATPPRVAEIGMNSFKELIAFPEQYEKILENVDIEVKEVFKSRTAETGE